MPLIDWSIFTDPRNSFDLLRKAAVDTLVEDPTKNKTKFKAVVLNTPAPIADNEVHFFGDLYTPSGETDLNQDLVFKARIIEEPSPHAFLPNPCDINYINNIDSPEDVLRIINAHTTFYAQGATKNSLKPGDIVLVELEKGQFSYNLQRGYFIKKIATGDGRNLQTCTNALTAFNNENFLSQDSILLSPEDGSSLDVSDETIIEIANEIRNMNQELLKKGMCGTNKSDLYPITKCKKVQGAYGHPVFLDNVFKAISDLESQTGISLRIGSSYRSLEQQVSLRIKNCGFSPTDKEAIINGKCKGSAPAAPPGYSRHEIGLAVDLSGGNPEITSTNENKKNSVRRSKYYRWLMENVYNKEEYGNIKSWNAKEPWHWSYDGR